MIVFVLGVAGSGKSTLVKAFGDWLIENGYSIARVNLDPGAESLLYDADYDVRSFVKLEEIMARYSLGPNGGLLKCMELMVERADKIAEELRSLEADYVLVDTPGQMELFAFRELGATIAERLAGISASIFLIDGGMISDPPSYIMSKLLSIAAQIRMGLPTIDVVSKGDLVEDRTFNLDQETIARFLERHRGLLSDLGAEIAEIVARFSSPQRLIVISSKNKEGFEDLHSSIYEIKCSCGDLT